MVRGKVFPRKSVRFSHSAYAGPSFLKDRLLACWTYLALTKPLSDTVAMIHMYTREGGHFILILEVAQAHCTGTWSGGVFCTRPQCLRSLLLDLASWEGGEDLVRHTLPHCSEPGTGSQHTLVAKEKLLFKASKGKQTTCSSGAPHSWISGSMPPQCHRKGAPLFSVWGSYHGRFVPAAAASART